EFAPRPALAQQIPALVERDLNAPEPLAVGIGRNTSGFAVEQFMLLARQPVDVLCHPAVIHAVSPSAFWARTLRISVARGTASPARLEQEPDALFGLVDPDFDEACCRHVIALVAETMDLAHAGDQRLVVLAQFAQHVQRVDVVGIVVGQTLQTRNMPDRTQSRSAQLAHALGYGIGDRVDL